MTSEEKAALIITSVIAVFIFLLAGTLAKASCHARGASFSQVRWGPIEGCLVEHDGRWVPLSNVRIITPQKG